MRQVDEYIIITSYDKDSIFAPIYEEILLITLCIIATSMLLVGVIFVLLKKHVINGIKEIILDLSNITEGNLGTTVEVSNNSEFRSLSLGINKMVQYLLQTAGTISKIIESLDLNIGVYEYRNDTNKVYMTDKLLHILGLNDSEINILSNDKQLFERKLLAIRQVIYESKDNETIYCISFAQGNKYIKMSSYVDTFWTLGVVIDVTDDINSRNNMIKERDHDELTGLLNRKGFNIRLSKLFSNTADLKVACAVMVDMDNLKYINDKYSHKMGDRYIGMEANVLKRGLRGHDIAARLGGDEFAMFFYGYNSKEEIMVLINQMKADMFSNFIMLNENEKQYLSFSAGYVFYPQFTGGISDLLHLADLAMYKVKQNGKREFQEYDLSINK